jgi:hypothetical protein
VVKIKNYLTDQLKQYFLASSVFYTDRPDHKKSYNEGKSVEKYDEIGSLSWMPRMSATTTTT